MHREAKNRRNTWCISRFFNEAGRKICRQDGCGDLFSASLRIKTIKSLLKSMNDDSAISKVYAGHPEPPDGFEVRVAKAEAA